MEKTAWNNGRAFFADSLKASRVWAYEDYYVLQPLPDEMQQKIGDLQGRLCACVDTRVHEAFSYLQEPHHKIVEHGPYLFVVLEKGPWTLVPEKFGGPVLYYPNKVKTGDLFRACENELPWKQEEIIVYGKRRKPNRFTCALSDTEGTPYRYSKTTKIAGRWPDWMDKFVKSVPQLSFANFVLCQMYPNGKSAIGWHSDDERSLVPGTPIVSLSLGTPRTFELFPKEAGLPVSVMLGNGDILVMGGDTQKKWRHRVVPEKDIVLTRVCLTFRRAR